MSVKDSQTLKQLQTRKFKLEALVLDKKVSLDEAQQEYSNSKSQLGNINKQIEDLSDKDIIVSEHALLRYIERVMGVDMDAIKEKILTTGLKTMISNMGNGKYPIGKGNKVMVKNNVITTIVTEAKV
jgi:hypothetical protein